MVESHFDFVIWTFEKWLPVWIISSVFYIILLKMSTSKRKQTKKETILFHYWNNKTIICHQSVSILIKSPCGLDKMMKLPYSEMPVDNPWKYCKHGLLIKIIDGNDVEVTQETRCDRVPTSTWGTRWTKPDLGHELHHVCVLQLQPGSRPQHPVLGCILLIWGCLFYILTIKRQKSMIAQQSAS